jgi:hypothetical protein
MGYTVGQMLMLVDPAVYDSGGDIHLYDVFTVTAVDEDGVPSIERAATSTFDMRVPAEIQAAFADTSDLRVVTTLGS